MSKFQNLSSAEFKKMVSENPDVKIIDCRTYEETIQYKINYHYLIDITQPGFAKIFSELNKEDVYLVYCHSGNRSAMLCNYMSKLGFQNLYNLEGGIVDYIRTGMKYDNN